jgi:4'-phosphopantetheinyl transferase
VSQDDAAQPTMVVLPVGGVIPSNELAPAQAATVVPTVIPAFVPAPGQVHLHLVSLVCTESELARLECFLTEDELQRCNRLIDRDRRDRAVAGRGLLRQMLGDYLAEEPGSVLLSEGEFGKLHLSEHLEHDSISFNLSHAGDRLLLAVCTGCEIGVDLEAVRLDLAFRPMAERYFSVHEQQELFSLPVAGQLAAFYRCWTRKEAYLKGTGTGFSQPANVFDVSLLPQHPPALLAHRGAPDEVERWSIRDVALPGGYCGAVAVEMDEPVVKIFF